ncbi:MAG: response regulator [Deltaproteobacteria bacterium]|nr:response regulator [Deltaproteobacteria bacterium]
MTKTISSPKRTNPPPQIANKYRNTINHIPEGYFEVDLAGTLMFVSKPLCELVGLPENKLLNLNNREYTSPATAKKMYRIFNRMYKTGKPAIIEDYRVRKDDKVMYLEISASLIRDEKGDPAGFKGLVRNVSDRIQAEKQKKDRQLKLQEAQRLESIGTLAGGIAHDFNNLLMAMQGNVSLMLLTTDKNHPHYTKLNTIERLITSGADLTKKLLGFARGGKYEPHPLSINAVVKSSALMFSRTRKEITIQENFQKDLWYIEADQGQIDLILLNLYVNAAQAMPQGGTLSLETCNVVLAEKDVQPFSANPGKYVRLSISDTGIGMDEETRQRIFEPFFSTRERGRGTGLGLASAHGIISNHGGFIKVDSKPDIGTTFQIFLPAKKKESPTDARMENDTDEKHVHDTSFQENTTILMVDDEDIVAEVGSLMLKSLGYHVITAKSGLEAIELYKADVGKITLVILDMIMPKLGGGETFDRLKEIDPDVKILLSSGYSINDQARQILEKGCKGFIQKPFNMEKLSTKIQKILN